jgi:hypothetical protein
MVVLSVDLMDAMLAEKKVVSKAAYLADMTVAQMVECLVSSMAENWVER